MVNYKKSITRILILSLLSISFLISNQLFYQKFNFNADLKLSYTGDSKIEMVNWESQNLMVEQNFIDDYSVVDIDINVGSSYNFSFKLSDANDVPITNSIVWMHIQFLPGMPLNLIYSKPLIYPVAYGPEYYGPYWWVYGLTDGNGTATFEITFNHDYLADFFDAFGTTGISSIEDIDLYIRVFSSNFLWADMAISNPSQYLCSTDGNIFNGTGIIPGYDFTNLSIQDPTYMHGRIHFHKGGLKVVTEEYYILEYKESENQYEDLIINFDIVKDEPVPTSVLGLGDWTYYMIVRFYDPMGVLKRSYWKAAIPYPGDNGGYFIFGAGTVSDLYADLGPGLSTLSLKADATEIYEASPSYRIPLEVRPPNWIKFGGDPFTLDLIDPFINMWGTSYVNFTQLPFESNYPHIMGKIWFLPNFTKTSEIIENSYQDYLKVDIICSINNSDNSKSEFPLRENIMLRPSNYEGLIAFDIGLGPEDAFLMNTNCSLRLRFDANYNGKKILEEQREIKIYILELEIVKNPTSNNRSVLWSAYNNQPQISDISVSIDYDTFNFFQGNLTLGEDEFDYGIKLPHVFNENYMTYHIDSFNDLLRMRALVSVTPIAVIGKRFGIQNHLFIKGIDWIPNENPTSLEDYSQIEFIGEKPDNNTEFTVVYEFFFNFTEGYFGCISLNGPSSKGIMDSTIKFDFLNNFLNKTKNDVKPLFIRYLENFEAGLGQYQLSYSIKDIISWENNFAIYNTHELEPFSVSINNTGFPLLTFEEVQQNNFRVIYGIRSQYDLGYGFQKFNGSYSNSIRSIYNNENNSNPVIDSNMNSLNISEVNDNALYVDIFHSQSEVSLIVERIPLFNDPEIVINFKLDQINIERIRKFGNLGVLQIKTQINLSNGTSCFNSTLDLPLNYTFLESYLNPQGCYNFNLTNSIQELFDLYRMSFVNFQVSFIQINEGEQTLPYVIIDEFKYHYNTHYLSMNDYKPRNPYGNFDVRAGIHTPHYFQIFSMPFRNSDDYPQFPDSVFNLLEGSKVNIGILEMPNITLVSRDQYVFNYTGSIQNITIKNQFFNMVPNLGFLIDVYNINDPIIQEGFLCLFNGSEINDSSILEKIHFYILIYPRGAPPNNILDNILSKVSNSLMPNIRANYRSCFDYYQTSPSEYHLSINDFFTEVANYRLNLNNYIEPPPVVAPIQSIDIPNENEWFWSDAPEFELSLIETNLNKLWYNINEIAINFSCTSTGTLNQTIWDILDDGKVTIKFHALDNFGIPTCEKIEIYKDATEPNTLLEFIPYKNNDIVNDSTVFSFKIDDSNGSGVYRTFYKINDGDWINYSESFTLVNLDPGYYVISFYSTDKVGNIEALKYITVELTDDLLQDNNLQPNPAIHSYNIILILMLFASISIITFARQVKKSRFDRFS